MNNKIEFVAPAHSLLLKQGVRGEERQVHKNKAASRQLPALTPSGSEEAFHATISGAFSDSQRSHT
jgi:hypothetical protein